jgi:HAD superfamily hydrolase (TIGR01509 family)
MKPVRGVLLDIDGTLVASNDAHAQAWVKALAEAGRRVPVEPVRRLIGMGGDKLLPRVSGIDPESAEGKHISRRRGEIFKSEFLPHLRPTPGAADLLRVFQDRGLKMAVATSAKKGELDPLLKVCGADRYIQSATSSDDAENSKPDPDIVQAAIERIGLPPGEVFLLGDTPYDVEAGRKAGIRVVAVRCGGWADAELHADEIYTDPADLAANLDECLARLQAV